MVVLWNVTLVIKISEETAAFIYLFHDKQEDKKWGDNGPG
jgi:hypothetical protein